MSTDNPSSINEISDLLNLEVSKLQNTINQGLKNSGNLILSEIIEVYYQVINVASITKMLKENPATMKALKENNAIITLIKNAEKEIDEKFNKNLHLLILDQLDQEIENSKRQIKEIQSRRIEKTKEEIEKQGEIYQKLRQIMSTKEFVDQYDKRLENK
jgi:hypothetical protein